MGVVSVTSPSESAHARRSTSTGVSTSTRQAVLQPRAVDERAALAQRDRVGLDVGDVQRGERASSGRSLSESGTALDASER